MASEGKRLTIGARAVAVAILTEAIRCCEDEVGDLRLPADVLADELVDLAVDVEYQPRAEKLILTINAGIIAADRKRAPSPAEVAITRAAVLGMTRCPQVLKHPTENDTRCGFAAGHDGVHTWQLSDADLEAADVPYREHDGAARI